MKETVIMECNELREHLHAYADGQLAPELADAVAVALTDCPDCQSELDEITTLSELAREGLLAPLDEVDFSAMADAVMARIRHEAASVEGVKVARVNEEPKPSILDRLGQFLGETLRFERPMAAFAVALVVLLVVGLNQSATEGIDDGSQAGDSTPQIAATPGATETQLAAKTADPRKSSVLRPTKHRRVRAPELHMATRNNVEIESSQSPRGVRLEFDTDKERARPAIVWHVEEGSEEAAN